MMARLEREYMIRRLARVVARRAAVDSRALEAAAEELLSEPERPRIALIKHLGKVNGPPDGGSEAA